MGCSDKGETPPPLPVKGSTADYGNLLDNQDLTSPSTPPPPPPHQRVGVLIRAERSSLMMHGTYNETRGRYTHLASGSTSPLSPTPVRPVLMCVRSCLRVCVHVSHSHLGLYCILCLIFVMCVTEECRHQSVSSKGLHPSVHPAVIYTCSPQPARRSDVIDWMITLPLTSIRSSPVVNQRLVSPHSPTSTLAILSPRHSVN